MHSLPQDKRLVGRPEREIADAVSLARRAAAIGREDPTALWTSGINLAYLAGELETGATHIERALVLNPNLAIAWSASAWLRMYLGEPSEAIVRFVRNVVNWRTVRGYDRQWRGS